MVFVPTFPSRMTVCGTFRPKGALGVTRVYPALLHGAPNAQDRNQLLWLRRELGARPS